jgi:hypothetical protein
MELSVFDAVVSVELIVILSNFFDASNAREGQNGLLASNCLFASTKLRPLPMTMHSIALGLHW